MPLRPRNLHRSRRTGLWQNWTVWVYFPLAVLLCLFGVCLWKSGRWLVKEDPLDKVSWAAVLAGESRDCERTDEAIKLYLDGRIDTIVISGDRIFRNRYTSEFMVNDYVREGVPRGKVFEFRQEAYSTLEEARLLIRQFRFQRLDTVVIITSNYHTARARRIYRKLSQGLPYVIVRSADYHAFDPASWWSSRESRKIWLGEWLKTVYGWWEVWRTPPESGKAEYQNLIPDVWKDRIGSAPEAGPGDGDVPEPPRPETPKADTARPADTAKAPAGDTASRDSLKGASQPSAPPSDSTPRATVTDTLRNRPDTSAAHPSADSARAHPRPAHAAPPKPAKSGKDSGKEAGKKSVEKGSEKKKKGR